MDLAPERSPEMVSLAPKLLSVRAHALLARRVDAGRAQLCFLAPAEFGGVVRARRGQVVAEQDEARKSQWGGWR